MSVFDRKSNLKEKCKRVLLSPLRFGSWLGYKVINLATPKTNQSKVRLMCLFILMIAIFVGFFDYPQAYNSSIDKINETLGTEVKQYNGKPFKLGLDLLGGTHLVYQADLSKITYSERADSMDGVRDVIERRVNALGVSEPKVQVIGQDRLVVELAGVSDVNEAINKIGETPLLEFKEQQPDEDKELTPEQQKSIDDYNQSAKEKAQDALNALDNGKSFDQVVTEYTEDELTKDNNGNLSWVAEDEVLPVVLEKIQNLNSGNYVPEVIEADDQFFIVKLLDKRKELVLPESNHILICYEGAERCEDSTTKEEALAKIEDLKKQATTENFEDLAKEHSTETNAETSAGYLGHIKKGRLVPEFEKILFELEDGKISEIVETQFGYHIIYRKSHLTLPEYNLQRLSVLKQTKESILPPSAEWMNTGLSGAQLERAYVGFDPQTGASQVNIDFNGEGKKLFRDLTKKNLGKPIAIFLDGSPISVPRVNAVITDGRAVITGRFTIVESKQLVQRLNAGALPVPIDLLSQQTIGPKLGQESLQKSLYAGIVGLILVCLFMIFYYRILGLVAVFSLMIYGIITLGLFKFFGFTLTLSGIAGFILSIGMAVDANVLIFERIKEELREGKPLDSASEVGFRRAWTSIRDGNLSTIITCIILAWFGTSFIKGFAITLIIGVIVSMGSAIIVTKIFMKALFTTPLKNFKFLYLGFKTKKK